MDIKGWLLEVGLKKLGPSAIRGAVLGLSGWLIAREGLLAPFGIVSDAVTHTTTIYWDRLNLALIASFPALLAAAIKLVNHQAVQALPKPQDTPLGT